MCKKTCLISNYNLKVNYFKMCNINVATGQLEVLQIKIKQFKKLISISSYTV